MSKLAEILQAYKYMPNLPLYRCTTSASFWFLCYSIFGEISRVKMTQHKNQELAEVVQAGSGVFLRNLHSPKISGQSASK